MADTSTLLRSHTNGAVRRSQLLRRLFFVALTLFLLAGTLNAFGVRSATTTASGGGYTLEVTYAEVSRAGLATPWSAVVTRAGGFGDTLVMAINASYFDHFDENGFDPDPSSSTVDGEWLIWEFDAPDGDTFTVGFDARLEPGVQFTSIKGITQVRGPDGDAIVEARYRTFAMP